LRQLQVLIFDNDLSRPNERRRIARDAVGECCVSMTRVRSIYGHPRRLDAERPATLTRRADIESARSAAGAELQWCGTRGDRALVG